MTDNLVLHLDGQRYEGWKAITIVNSLQQVADSFTLSLSDAWLAPRKLAAPQVGMPATISLDNDVIASGYLEDVDLSYGDGVHEISATGYSKAYDLLVCSNTLTSKNYNNVTLLELARQLCQPFGISVSADTDVGKPFNCTLDPGQPIMDLLVEYARYRGVVLTSTSSGDLLITKAGTQRTQTPLKLGVNIMRAAPRFSARDVYTEYHVVGQDAGANWDAADEKNPASSKTAYYDKQRLYGRYKPLVITCDSPVSESDCIARSKAEAASRWARARQVIYTVGGWRQYHDGPVWPVNHLVRVDDYYAGIKEDQLIVERRLILDNRGQRTELLIMPPAAYDPIPLPDPDASGGLVWAQQ